MHDEQAALVLEGGLHLFEELLGVEHHRRAERIGHVHDHRVELLAGVLDEGAAIADFQAVALVGERAVVDLRHQFFAELHHAPVEFGHHRLVDRVLQDFAQNAAVAGADDQHVLGIRVGAEHRVDHRFVVEELVLRGHLRHAVEQQDVAELLALDDLHLLPLGLAAVEGLPGLVEVAEGGVEALDEVTGHGFS